MHSILILSLLVLTAPLALNIPFRGAGQTQEEASPALWAGIQCGVHAGGALCQVNPESASGDLFCCSKWGWCGTSELFCGSGNCQSGPCVGGASEPDAQDPNNSTSTVVTTTTVFTSETTCSTCESSTPAVTSTTTTTCSTCTTECTSTQSVSGGTVNVVVIRPTVTVASESTSSSSTVSSEITVESSLVVVTTTVDAEPTTTKGKKASAATNTIQLQLLDAPPAYDPAALSSQASSRLELSGHVLAFVVFIFGMTFWL